MNIALGWQKIEEDVRLVDLFDIRVVKSAVENLYEEQLTNHSILTSNMTTKNLPIWRSAVVVNKPSRFVFSTVRVRLFDCLDHIVTTHNMLTLTNDFPFSDDAPPVSNGARTIFITHSLSL